ncbi:MAG: hypothetical protein NT025_05540 [bacterium]|nr:hypothetical protein [bacterium]
MLVVSGCTSPADDNNTTGPGPELSLSVEAQPSAIPANGSSHLVVFVELLRGAEPVSDSTEVILLNTIGTLGRGVVYTRNGVALDTLTSDTTAGSGWLIAYAQGRRDSTEIMFTLSP